MPQTKSAYNTFKAHNDRNASTVIRAVGEKVWLCDSHDVLFLQKMGGLDAGRGRFGFSSIGALSYEWIVDHNLPTSVKITAALAKPTAGANDGYGQPTYSTDLLVTVDNPQYLFRGMVLYGVGWTTDSNTAPEYMWVSSVDMANKQATVVRGWRGTPVHAYPATGASLCILTIVAEECHEFVLNANVARSTAKNYWQTFVAGLSKSKKYDHIEHYGVEDDYQRQMTRIMGGTIEGRTITGELPRMLEQAILYGLPSAGGPNGDSSFGGINSFAINQVIVPNLTFDTIQDALYAALMGGADIGRLEIVTSPAIQRMLSGWTDGTVTVSRSETQVGRKVTSILSDWGEVPIEWHRLLRPNELYILDFSEMGILQLWEFQETRLGISTSLCEDTMIDGAYGFALACECHHTRVRVDSTCLPGPCTGPGCVTAEPLYTPPPNTNIP